MNEISRRLLIVPRWAGHPTSDFYVWLLATLRAQHPGLFQEARVLELPRPELPDLATWPAAISDALGRDPGELAGTYVLAHSVGCQALLRSLAELPAGAKIAGALCVAGWWQVDKPWDSIVPWLAPIPGLARAASAISKLTVLLSDNDPFTADHGKNGQLWKDQLAAQVQLVPGGRHFNAAEEPAVLDALLTLCHP